MEDLPATLPPLHGYVLIFGSIRQIWKGSRTAGRVYLFARAPPCLISLTTRVREMDQDHSLVKKLNISIDLVVYNTIIIDKIRVASSPLVDNFLVTEDGESNT